MQATDRSQGCTIRRGWAILWLIAISTLACPGPVARAQQDHRQDQGAPGTQGTQEIPASPWVTETESASGWIITLGGYGDLEPKFEGARHHTVWFHPIIDYRPDGSREWLSLPNDGFDFPLIVTDSFRAGPVVN